MRPEGGFGGTPTAITYTDARFESVTDEVEDLLGDLLGVEAASEQMLHLYDARSEADEAAGEKTQTTTFQLTMPTRHSYTVFPVLEISYGDEEQNQALLNTMFEAGKAGAGGFGAWMRSIMDNYYLVDAAALIGGGQRLQDLATSSGFDINRHAGDLNESIHDHWIGEGADQYLHWSGTVETARGALLLCATVAAASAMACGIAIASTQEAMLKHAEEVRDGLKKTLAAWRADAKNFPLPPAIDNKLPLLSQMVGKVVQEIVDAIPLPEPIASKGLDVVLGRAAEGTSEKAKMLGKVLGAYDTMVTLTTEKNDIPPQPKASYFSATMESHLRQIRARGDENLASVATKSHATLAFIQDDRGLVAPRLDRTPEGHYDADAD